MGEFMTQPLQVGHVILFFVILYVGLFIGAVIQDARNAAVSKQVDELQNLIYRTDKSLDNFRCEVRAQVCDLDETVESISDTLWAIEDDVDALRRPAWKKLLRRLSE